MIKFWSKYFQNILFDLCDCSQKLNDFKVKLDDEHSNVIDIHLLYEVRNKLSLLIIILDCFIDNKKCNLIDV